MTRFLLLLLVGSVANASDNQAMVDSYEMVWSTLRDHYWDPNMAGLNWQQLHDQYLPQVKAARSVDEARMPIDQLIRNLPSSHLTLLPGEMYGDGAVSHARTAHLKKAHGGPGMLGISVAFIEGKAVVEFVDVASPAEEAGVQPGWIIDAVDGDSVQKPLQIFGDLPPSMIPRVIESFLSGPVGSKAEINFSKGDGSRKTLAIQRSTPSGKLVQFSNFPPLRVIAEHRPLANGCGYIRLNIFLDPVSVMPEFERSISEFRNANGIILDLRGNPGGLASMGAGIAGWFVAEDGASLGTMIKRNARIPLLINPRLEPYLGKLAILVNGSSASTSEFLAQGLKDMGRARIFGTRTAGEALPSNIIELPDGDRFEYPEASYTSNKGLVLEKAGVEPDQVVAPTIEALLAGHDLALEAAMAWSVAK